MADQYSGQRDPLCHSAQILTAMGPGRVDVAEARLERLLKGRSSLFLFQLPGAEANLGDLSPVGQSPGLDGRTTSRNGSVHAGRRMCMREKAEVSERKGPALEEEIWAMAREGLSRWASYFALLNQASTVVCRSLRRR